MLSWGNWDVRVYAAEAYVSLAQRFGAEYNEIVEMFDAILSDPVPTVRLQAAQNLQVLHRIAPERFWLLAERIASREPNEEVLASFLCHVVPRFAPSAPERCEAIIETVLRRPVATPTEKDADRAEVGAMVGGLVAQLWVWQRRPRALEWLTKWASDPFTYQEILTSFLSTLRDAFFERYAPIDGQDHSVSDRAQRAAIIILEASSALAESSYLVLSAGDIPSAERQRYGRTYESAEAVLHHLMNQLYFGAGAFAHNRDLKKGLITPETMRQFLADYRPLLALLANSRQPATHHRLVELYEYVIPGDPAGVFNALHALLLGAGAREGYHHESLASTVIVRMVTRYIADYRSIFEDDEKRRQLIEILRLFSDVGWPDALKLLYDLPDLLR